MPLLAVFRSAAKVDRCIDEPLLSNAIRKRSKRRDGYVETPVAVHERGLFRFCQSFSVDENIGTRVPSLLVKKTWSV